MCLVQVKHTKNRLVFLRGRPWCFDAGEQAVSVRLDAEMLGAELLDGRVSGFSFPAIPSLSRYPKPTKHGLNSLRGGCGERSVPLEVGHGAIRNAGTAAHQQEPVSVLALVSSLCWVSSLYLPRDTRVGIPSWGIWGINSTLGS